MKKIAIAFSSILTAFEERPIGTKIIDHTMFIERLSVAIEVFDFEAQRVPGQGFLVMPDAMPFVSAGDGPKTDNPDDYHLMVHRGEVSPYLKRDRAGEVAFCAAVVYTREAYAADPEVTAEEAARVSEATHVLVAVIASSGPQSPLTPHRLVANLAGGNREALAWSADEIRAKALEVHDYWSAWSVVAG